MPMLFDILTIFPELFTSPLQEGILRRAIGGGKITVNMHNIRDYATDKHKMTDDRPFGGGEGMVMKPEPLVSALEEPTKNLNQPIKAEDLELEDLDLDLDLEGTDLKSS